MRNISPKKYSEKNACVHEFQLNSQLRKQKTSDIFSANCRGTFKGDIETLRKCFVSVSGSKVDPEVIMGEGESFHSPLIFRNHSTTARRCVAGSREDAVGRMLLNSQRKLSIDF